MTRIYNAPLETVNCTSLNELTKHFDLKLQIWKFIQFCFICH